MPASHKADYTLPFEKSTCLEDRSFEAISGTNLVTSPPKFGGPEDFVGHLAGATVGGGQASSHGRALLRLCGASQSVSGFTLNIPYDGLHTSF